MFKGTFSHHELPDFRGQGIPYPTELIGKRKTKTKPGNDLANEVAHVEFPEQMAFRMHRCWISELSGIDFLVHGKWQRSGQSSFSKGENVNRFAGKQLLAVLSRFSSQRH